VAKAEADIGPFSLEDLNINLTYFFRQIGKRPEILEGLSISRNKPQMLNAVMSDVLATNPKP
jgi:hypothetical protein